MTGAAIAGAVCVVACAIVWGWAGLLASVLAVVLMLAFLLVGQVPLVVAGQGLAGAAGMLLVLGYFSRLVLALAAVVALRSGALVAKAVGITLIVSALGWTVGTVWGWRRWQPLVVDVPLPSDGTPAGR